MRNPARTATTSAALMVGLGLVVFVAVFAAGLKTLDHAAASTSCVRADIVVTAQGFQPLPPDAQDGDPQRAGRATPPSASTCDQIEVNGTQVNQLDRHAQRRRGAPLPLDVYRPHWLHGADDRLLARLRGDAARSSRSSSPRPTTSAVGDAFRDRRRRSGGTATLTRDRRVPRPADPAGHRSSTCRVPARSRRCTTRSRSSSRRLAAPIARSVAGARSRPRCAASRPRGPHQRRQYRATDQRQVDQHRLPALRAAGHEPGDLAVRHRQQPVPRRSTSARASSACCARSAPRSARCGVSCATRA